MRIAILTDTYLPQINGVTNTISQLVDFLDRNGYDYCLFAPEDGPKIDRRVNYMRSLSLPFYPELRLALPNYSYISSRLEQFRPDIVHIVTPFSIGFPGFWWVKKNEIPVVSSYHTNFDQYLKYYGFGLLSDLCWEVFRWFHNQTLRVYCPSENTRELLKEKGIKNLEIWTRGVDATAFHPDYRDTKLRNQYGVPEGKVLLSYVGRLAREKDLDVLMAAVDILNKSISDNFHLLLTGDGPFTDDIRAWAPKNVSFTGYKKGKELSAIYASADIFVFPSSTETLGNVLLEAMASGLPSIGANAGGIPYNLQHGVTGYLFEPGNAEEMAVRLRELILDSAKRVDMARTARTAAEQRSWDAVFKKLLLDYQKVIEMHGKPVF